MAKIRIKKGPTNQIIPGQKNWNSGDASMQKPSTSIARSIQSVPREDANIEAEKGETALVPNKGGLPAHFNIGGNRHNGGGTPLNVPDDTFIFSDTKKMRIKDPDILAEFGKAKGSWTPADLAKKYDINKFRKLVQDPDSDLIQIKTGEKMIANYNLKLGKLALVQESKKGFPQGIPAVAMPYLATFNIQPDTILPLKAEQGMQQSQASMPMGRYGMFLPRAQYGYIDPRKQKSIDPNQTTYFDTTQNTTGYTTGSEQGDIAAGNTYQVSKDSQFNPNDSLYGNTQDYMASQEQQGQPSGSGSMFAGWRPEGEDLVNWGIAGMYGAANLFNQDDKRREEERNRKRQRALALGQSRQDRDRGDYTSNYGYFRPDQQSAGNMITGKYGGVLPKAQNGTQLVWDNFDPNSIALAAYKDKLRKQELYKTYGWLDRQIVPTPEGLNIKDKGSWKPHASLRGTTDPDFLPMDSSGINSNIPYQNLPFKPPVTNRVKITKAPGSVAPATKSAATPKAPEATINEDDYSW